MKSNVKLSEKHDKFFKNEFVCVYWTPCPGGCRTGSACPPASRRPPAVPPCHTAGRGTQRP
jgi:hypothetical protein